MFNSNNFKETGSGPKVLNPGTHYVRIVDVQLERPAYAKEGENPYNVIVTIEGVDEGDSFDGFLVDKNNPSMGKYRGKIAAIRSKRFAFSDYEYNGKEITRDSQIFNWINNLASQWGVLSDMNKANVSGDTIEEYVENARRYIINPEIWGYVTFGGEEYFKEGYDKPNYRSFFPNIDFKSKLYPFVASEEAGDEEPLPAELIKFDAKVHILVKDKDASQPAAEVTSFEKTDALPANDFPNPGDAPMSDVDLPM
jgi:hypothetical protein